MAAERRPPTITEPADEAPSPPVAPFGRRPPILPRPPTSKNAVEYVVIVFVTTVASILMTATVALVVASVVDPEQDRSQTIGQLSDILTTIIGALIGYIAGKGHGRSEVQDEMAQEWRQTHVDPIKQSMHEHDGGA